MEYTPMEKDVLAMMQRTDFKMIWQISIREGMKAAEQRMKELQKLMENGENYLQYKPIHAELKKLKNG